MPPKNRPSWKGIKDDIEGVTPTSPLRLEIAARIAFPDGSMTAKGLRREAARGRLIVELIANKSYTTLSHIEEMRRLCRVQADPELDISKRVRSERLEAEQGEAASESLQHLVHLMRKRLREKRSIKK